MFSEHGGNGLSAAIRTCIFALSNSLKFPLKTKVRKPHVDLADSEGELLTRTHFFVGLGGTGRATWL